MAAESKPDHDTDVVIIGAGPVGLLLSILLGRAGTSVTVYDKWPEIYDRPRAVTMDAEVARILATLGIDVDNDPGFQNHKELYYWKNADLENLQIVDWESLAPCGWHVTYWFNQPELEARLMDMAQALPTVSIERGWTAVDLVQSETSARVTLVDTAKGQSRRKHDARFLVGADGANSFVREALGLKTVDKGYFFDWLILDMIPPKDFVVSPAQWQLCDPRRPTTIVPGGPGRRRWEFMVLPDENSEDIAKPETAWRLMEPWGLTPQNSELERSAVYRFQAKWSEHWISGRCMIAGDAAHLMPPFAGEGMCAGLRDAVALGWRLNAVLKGPLGQGVFQSYESERIAHAKHYIQFSQDLGNIICIADAEQAKERDARMKADLAARNFEPITGDLVKLGAGLWCDDAQGAGELSPQGRVRFKAREDRFDQAVGQGWFILGLNTPTENLLRPDQSVLFAKLGGRVLSVGPSAATNDVIALDSAYANWSAETGASFAIIRPDFYVAATAATPETLRACFDTLTVRMGLT
ncbi:bifunctional 3-(3-hydroxy-phenyl)propionate/3-hydroxycinnamic acid hydroxylase [uncultured Litoreibacter sp.]|uniref:bifunctional 3-(3-hydroxy-phenyl)propionate/3-hydroxycinnamic acid hydroxylase MhpA n=1 Tax=uncultured Litoreibacter sp. TaxID=1392394 RepID=UPI00262E57E4|nr:bifunctional 3-(3-hydroxy-phenyl)propionate/3-hydroxycinnamic acid hydroxylase [uncultured Litoreibacter sp.]